MKRWHAVLFPDADLPLDAIPSLPIGGWAGWPYAVGSSLALKNAVGDQITKYCLLDPDYRWEAEIAERYKAAEAHGVKLHVWSAKEIENFLLQPRPIRRVFAMRVKGCTPPTEAEIWSKILEFCEGERRLVEDGFASAAIQANRKLDVKTANRMARSRVDELWKSERKRPLIVSGKDLLARLSDWAKNEFGFGFGAPAIARNMTAPDIPEEIANVISAIETGASLPDLDDRESYSGSAA